ncbi:diguanylate cyclase [Clostridium sp. AM58-1XD]|uniref:sensor domain-containing diguanylate cyclase n=1 Tax=Clostridium sp. AM58-1XD TaxID=2292307 RepID=UPI000E504E89|nr:diguanylate cyclase [Clostridium sp. AM58-1XD]RGY95328.1 diguanylate cyclase [Clostridium sp. AM58-1XD]
MNIRNSMYQLVIALIVVPFLMFGLLLTFTYNVKLKKVVQESLEAVANSQLAEMGDFCGQQRNNLNILGSMDVSQAALRGKLDQDMLRYLDNILYSRVQATQYLKSIMLVDTNNHLIASSNESSAAHADLGLDTLIDRMNGDSFYITNTLSYQQNGRNVQSVIAIAKIADHDKVIGYVLSEINLDFYDNIRKRAKLWNESTFYLLDGNQNIISAGTQDDKRETFVTSNEERKDYQEKYNAIDFAAHPQGSFTYRVGKNSYITYYSNVEYTDWHVLLSVNMDCFLSRVQISFLLFSFLMLLCTILTVLLGRFVSRRIVQPIHHISDTLNGIQQNQDYSLRIETVRKDELGTLSEEINGLLSFIETENVAKAKREQLLQEMAQKDALTQVYNAENIRRYLSDAIDRHQSDSTPMAVLFVDVDDFKAFNTNYGHSVGDQALLFIASLLVRETGGIVGRVGGDEFLSIVEERERLAALESGLDWVNNPSHSRFVLRGSRKSLLVACSIGAVVVDFKETHGESITAEQLMGIADTAMYEAKNNGKCRYVIQHYPI